MKTCAQRDAEDKRYLFVLESSLYKPISLQHGLDLLLSLVQLCIKIDKLSYLKYSAN